MTSFILYNLTSCDFMKCTNCGKTLKNEIIVFCEKCEEYYCMKCSRKHKNHGLTFLRLDKDNLKKIHVGVGGAGIGDTHHKFYTDSKWISRKNKCSHAESMVDLGYPIFYCNDGKIRCFDCIYDLEIILTDPLIKINDNDMMMWLLPSTYDPYNLEFRFDCDNNGIKGENISLNITIKNKKSNPIEDINICVEAFAADPQPPNITFNEYADSLYQNYVILKKFNFDSLGANEDLIINFEVEIPLDYEIMKGQIGDFSEDKIHDGESSEIEYLKIPNDLMIYAHFNYKTCSGFKFWSYIEKNIVKLK